MWRLCVGCVAAVIAFGQNPQPSPAFEVADIRLNTSGPGESNGDISNGRLTIRNVPLRYLIAEAWTLTQDEVYGPPWFAPAELDDVRVDVVAKAASPRTPDAEVRQMLQTLLKDRMKLVARTEQREKAVWALSVWKGQPKMTPSEMPAKPEDSDCSMGGGEKGTRLICKRPTMAALAQLESSGGLTLFAALQAQLGLQLEAKKLPVPVLVIDSIERTLADN